jgi:hypothetical protein
VRAPQIKANGPTTTTARDEPMYNGEKRHLEPCKRYGFDSW